MTAEVLCAALVALLSVVGWPPAGRRRRGGIPRRRRVRGSGRSAPSVGLGRAVRVLSGVPWRGRAQLPSQGEVAVLADQIAGLARAGLPPGRIWRSIAERSAPPAVRDLAAAVVAGQFRGEPVAAAMRVHVVQVVGRRGRPRLPFARVAGPPALLQLVVAVDVSERTGAALAVTLTRLAEALRQEEAAAQERESALAGPRATAGVLAVLPLAGLALGGLLGGDPADVLVSTPPGRVCLVAGGLLWCVGRAWTARLVRRASRA
ncbi:MAG TPA: type II secretion system F family protein [Kineosporiaceae bacterium]